MTSYVSIPNGDIDQDSPITQPLMTALRDNPIAIAEADSTVPESLRSTELLGTLTTTSGSTQTLSGLVLTRYRSLWISINGVSATNNYAFRFAGNSITAATVSAFIFVDGYIQLNLENGVFISNLDSTPAYRVITSTTDVFVGKSIYTNASTSISFSVSAGTFDAGSIKIYGVK